jgi:ATP-dependent RNA helicase DeaD
MHSDANQSHDEILQVLRKAGCQPPTPVQEKLAPLILKGRDAVVESARASEPAPGFILPFILGLRGAGLAPHALLLLPAREDVEKISQAVTRFMRVVRDVPVFVPLGEIEDARREQRRLEKGATIVAGTTERVIDHIRRGSLDVRELASVVVQEPEGESRADFIKDVQFIFARLSGRHQAVLLSASPAGQESELMPLLRHPVVVTAAAGAASLPAQEKEHLLFEVPDTDKVQALARVLLGRKVPSALVLCSSRIEPRKVAQALQARLLRAVAWPSGPLSAASGQARPDGLRRTGRPARGGEEKASIQAALSRGEADVVVASSLPEGFSPSHVVYLDLPAGNRPVRWTSHIMALAGRGQEKDVARLQEAIGVTLKKEDLPTDADVVIGSIDRVLRNLEADTQKAELARLRSLIRRQVPFLKRPLFMAYLLKSMLPAGTGAAAQTPAAAAPSRAFAGRETPAVPGRAAPRKSAPAGAEPGKGSRGRFGRSVEVPLPSAETGKAFTQLFVSIGRNRRVYARELAELFTEKLQLSAHELGSVRVFDKYSFVDINPSRADEAITRLSGSELKGRTITVNYAKKKEEKGEP